MKKIFIVTILFVFLSSCNTQDKQDNLQLGNQNTQILNNSGSQQEEDFNNSWRAKAIEKETDLWSLYNNPEVWISFNYPNDVTMLDNNTKKDDSKTYVQVDISDMQQWEWPMRLSNEDEMKNVEALASWKFWIEQDFPLTISEKVKSVGSLFAQDFIVLSRFDICSVTLERKLLFYFNNKQITITLYWPISKLDKDYLTTNKDNCWDQMIWDTQKQEKLYTSLVDWKANLDIQKWYDYFDKISDTIVFSHK